MKNIFTVIALCLFVVCAAYADSDRPPISDATLECLDCHGSLHPGIVEDWRQSRHAKTIVQEALRVTGINRKVNGPAVPEAFKPVAVGCAECHTANPETHADTFEHNGYDVHTIVTPTDCSICHAEEAGQFEKNVMAYAHGNLEKNPVYQDLVSAIIGDQTIDNHHIQMAPPSPSTKAEACLYCHGTSLKIKGFENRETDMGEMTFPVIAGWPNQGVGRINPDESRGACSACHTRHSFSIEMARKPHTCKECHIGPDVPAFKIYTSSKHGNIYASLKHDWNFTRVPWTVGEDFTAPTCAACHMSLLDNTDGDVVSFRTHQISDRLGWRIFGLVYAHPQPRHPDTSRIKNKTGLALPTDWDGEPAQNFLIDSSQKAQRTDRMQAVCRSCHARTWVKAHWDRYETTIAETNRKTRTATEIMQKIWTAGYAQGLDRQQNPFDEAIERQWSDIWLFYANTIRFASAMAGGGDYGVFANGRYALSKEILKMNEWLKRRPFYERELSSPKNTR
jgi:hydroxylamine dehydrogenase